MPKNMQTPDIWTLGEIWPMIEVRLMRTRFKINCRWCDWSNYNTQTTGYREAEIRLIKHVYAWHRELWDRMIGQLELDLIS